MSILKKIWKNGGKHKKLNTEWDDLSRSECSLFGGSVGGARAQAQFACKYAGAAPVERASSAPLTAKAVSALLAVAKASGKKMRRVTLNVSLRGVNVSDAISSEHLLDVSIYRISYCSADAAHGSVFAFVSGGAGEQLACHAFLCAGRKRARQLTLALAHAFNAAYQAWQASEDALRMQRALSKPIDAERGELLDFTHSSSSSKNNISPWVSFDEDDLDSEEDLDSWQANDNTMPLVCISATS